MKGGVLIPDISPVNTYAGNGSATTFDFDFYIDDSSQLKVYCISSTGVKTLLVENVDYSVNEFTPDTSRVNPDFTNGGYIIFPLEESQYSILADNEKIILQLDIPFSQESEYNNSSLLNLESLEYSLDYLTRLTQILKRQLTRVIKIDEGADEVDLTFPNPEALKVIGWSQDGLRLENKELKIKTYIHNQSVASAAWEINHNLNKLNIRAVIIDSSGTVFNPPVVIENENTCRIELIGATTGTAYIN